ncbi:type I 3-dehydroquinate dehydratase [Chloroflexota bacterium]
MNKPIICTSLVTSESKGLEIITPLVDLFEVRIDMIGRNWQELVKRLGKPWMACNRYAQEGGKGSMSEEKRLDTLLKAVDLGASIVDIELRTRTLADMVPLIKQKAECLISFHNFESTPPLEDIKNIVRSQIKAGADICKVVCNARKPEDNLTALQLIKEFPENRIVSFCMGELGIISRLLSALAGGYFTYASIQRGKESASGQLTVEEITKLFKMVQG